MDISHLAIYSVALSSRGAEFLRRTRQVQRRRIAVTSALFRAAVTAGLAVQRDVWCLASSKDWWERIALETYTDEQWRADFRMSRGTFNIVCDRLRPSLERQDTQLRRAITVEKRVAITLYWLATGSFFHVVVSLFWGGNRNHMCYSAQSVCVSG